MEERLVDKEDERLIRIKKKAEGMDAEDALTEEGEESAESEEEVLVTLPEEDGSDEEDYDEDLVGLTATELKRELERRKKAEEEAREEYDKLVSAGKEALESDDFENADSLFSQATCYPFADAETVTLLWTARTKNFTDTETFYDPDHAEEFSAESDEAKAFVREKMGEQLNGERQALQSEEAQIAPAVLEKQEERRQAFAGNRKYYTVRLCIFLGLLGLFAIGTIVSATYIVRTLSSLPVILTGVFGGLTLIAFIVALVYLMKFSGANKLCRTNDRLSSTEAGARLVRLREKLECLKLILEDETEE